MTNQAKDADVGIDEIEKVIADIGKGALLFKDVDFAKVIDQLRNLDLSKDAKLAFDVIDALKPLLATYERCNEVLKIASFILRLV